ncbi:transmembrane protein 33-like isoform X7 [Carcharodon carcharias]|uniref:transmembrane protein 33-like isoform X7 n=1 Tax=Carcharodon carcharias TaxID=13397 RepID=UPI001B7EA058|nr:transmembrane protein 33-like isoform X7 [Carcharodon carcharias]
MAEQGSADNAKADSTTQSTDPTGSAGVGDGGNKTTAPVSVSQFMMSNKTESIMWLLRLFTLVSTFFFLFPILGVVESGHFYQRALLANALTSACRLHQRLPRFKFSRAYVTQALLEDSCHYLLYSLIFITSYPITLCLVPVAVFSLLHATAYTRKVLDIIGPNSIPWVRSFLDKMTTHQQSLFKFIACNEILLMPAAVFMLLGACLWCQFDFHCTKLQRSDVTWQRPGSFIPPLLLLSFPDPKVRISKESLLQDIVL